MIENPSVHSATANSPYVDPQEQRADTDGEVHGLLVRVLRCRVPTEDGRTSAKSMLLGFAQFIGTFRSEMLLYHQIDIPNRFPTRTPLIRDYFPSGVDWQTRRGHRRQCCGRLLQVASIYL